MLKAVFLDRDGVINRAIVRDGRPYPPCDVSALEILPDVQESLNALHKAGWLLVVVTNQPDVARGTTTLADVEAINQQLRTLQPITEFRTCYHDDKDYCKCRKPLPGSFFSSAAQHNIDLKASYMIGDRWRDIEAGQNAGCKTIFIDYQYNEQQPLQYDYRVGNLKDATEIILGRKYENC